MNYKPTLRACYLGYFVQAIVNNLPPILFTTFSVLYGVPIEKIALLIVINFGTQIFADIVSVLIAEKAGFRKLAQLAHVFCTLGLLSMGILVKIMPSPFVALAISMIISALGGGLLEVLVSPIVDLIPTNAKSASMSLLHSFYCWGQVSVILISTLLLRVIGRDLWFVLPLFWAIIPFLNFVAFSKVPIPPNRPPEHTKPLKLLFRKRLFWLGLLLMFAAGASELAMSQWSSAFAEASLNINKTLGDLLGPCLFGVFMALGRTWYGVFGAKISLKKTLSVFAALSFCFYILTAISPWPIISLLSCALCGLFVSLFWPGIFSLCAASLKGNTAMFGVFAIMGDIGCAVGPWLVGMVAGSAGGAAYLSKGLLVGSIFPAIMFFGMFFVGKLGQAEGVQKSFKN